jgi:two-component system, LytTR family, response regulator LytT
MITHDSKQFLTDSSLENIEIDLDPSCFFKISRNCIAGLNSIKNISKYFNSRLKVTLSPQQISPVIVPRSRVANFLEWLEGSK